MLKIFTSPERRSRSSAFCDGISRRNFLKIGGLGSAAGGLGLSLPDLLALESGAGIGSSHKSVILIYLVGGPPHQDMFDLKPDAPSEYAGPHRPIGTNVDGIEICELFPQMAKRMDKFAVIRSLVGAQGFPSVPFGHTASTPQASTNTDRAASIKDFDATRVNTLRRRSKSEQVGQSVKNSSSVVCRCARRCAGEHERAVGPA